MRTCNNCVHKNICVLNFYDAIACALWEDKSLLVFHNAVIDGQADMISRLSDENRALKTELTVNQKEPDQQAKSDAGKPRLTLVPPRIIWDIAAVRQYGVEVKYPKTGADGWRTIGLERIRDAAARHFMRYLADPSGIDEESGLPHLWHCATNIAFLCELEDDADDGNV